MLFRLTFTGLTLALLISSAAYSAERNCTLDIPVAKFDAVKAKFSDNSNEVTEELELSKQVKLKLVTNQCDFVHTTYHFTFPEEKKENKVVGDEYRKAIELLAILEKDKNLAFLQEKSAIEKYLSLVVDPKLGTELYTRPDGTFSEKVVVKGELSEKPWIEVITIAGPY